MNEFTIEDFEIDYRNPIGEGGFGSVYKATKKDSNEVYAIKKISIEKLSENEILKIQNIINMKLLNKCENSIKYFGYFEDENFIYLIMELCDYSLNNLIRSKNFNAKEIKEILEQLNNVFKIMHRNSIIHRNIKPENILIKNLENNKCLYKFGLSNLLTQNYNAEPEKATDGYTAPEIINDPYDNKLNVDLWNIGILIHKLFFGKNPKINYIQDKKKIHLDEKSIQKTNNIYLDDLIKKLLIEKPFDNNKKNNSRISWEEYFNHNFFKNNYIEEVENLKKSLEKFNNTINDTINDMMEFIINKTKEFNNLINKEIEIFFTDEYNENIKNLSKLLNDFNFNNDENKIIEMIKILNKSIINFNEISEFRDLNGNILYDGNALKGTNIKFGKGIEYKINKDNILFEGEYLNGKRWNGKVKEYYDWNGKLKFEGEYSNGEINGNGIEYYDNGILKFEGEYLNGKRWNVKGKFGNEIINGKGKVKEYYVNANLKFDGEYLNGERNGNGKEYFSNGNLKFEGEYINGKKWNGEGKECYSNGKLIFEGEYLDGKRWKGKGKEFYKSELTFEGEYLKGKRWKGKGKEYYSNGELIFEGEYLNGERWIGKGKEYYSNGELKFEGEYFNGSKWNGKVLNINGELEFEMKNGNGKGKEYDNEGELIFEGEYSNGERLNGNGKEYDDNGELIFEGDYSNGERWNGQGKEYGDKDELLFDGKYLNGERWNGKGKEYYKNGELIFEGQYLNGKKKGIGKEYNKNGELIFEGQYLNGERYNGKGKEYNDDGELIFEGEYLNGEKQNINN